MALPREEVRELARILDQRMLEAERATQRKPRKRKPKLRLVPAPKLLHPAGFAEHALEKLPNWCGDANDGLAVGRFTLSMCWNRWHEQRGSSPKLYLEPDWDALVVEIYAKNNAKIAACFRYPRLAAVNGVRVG